MQHMRLFELRRKSGLSQREVAKKVGVSYSRISAYERDPSIRIKMPTLKKLADLYGTTVEFIEGESLAPAPAKHANPDQLSEDEALLHKNYKMLEEKSQALAEEYQAYKHYTQKQIEALKAQIEYLLKKAGNVIGIEKSN